MEIQPISGAIGAEITGVDLAALEVDEFAALHKALLDYGVISIHGQALTADQQIAFARRWGDIHAHPYLSGLDGNPEIIEIVKEAGDPNRFGAHWHTDQVFTPAPAMATMLLAREVPPVGGDTLFTDLYAAYDALSDGMKRMACRLRTVNTYDKGTTRSKRMGAKVLEPEKEAVPAVHPLVRVHPETGKRALYINDTRIMRRFEDMTEAESKPLLDFFLTHETRPEFTCRVRWQVGTLGLWDNRRLMHLALDDYQGHRRVMHRITIKGTPTIGVDPSEFPT